MWADDWQGRPFTDPGFTCGDLVRQVLARQFGIVIGDPGPAVDAGSYITALKASGEWIEVFKPEPGDVLLMNTAVAFGEAAPLHVGIMATPGHVLHVDRNRRSCCERISSPSIRHRMAGFYRHRKLA